MTAILQSVERIVLLLIVALILSAIIRLFPLFFIGDLMLFVSVILAAIVFFIKSIMVTNFNLYLIPNEFFKKKVVSDLKDSFLHDVAKFIVCCVLFVLASFFMVEVFRLFSCIFMLLSFVSFLIDIFYLSKLKKDILNHI